MSFKLAAVGMAAFGLISFSTPALTQSSEDDREEAALDIRYPCRHADGGSARILCFETSTNKAIAQMTDSLSNFEALLKDYESTAPHVALQAAQQKWQESRDADCALESLQWEGGSMSGSVAQQCIIRMTRARAVELDIIAESFAPM